MKHNGKVIYPLIVTDISGVLWFGGNEFNDSLIDLLTKLRGNQRKLICFSTMSQSMFEQLSSNSRLSEFNGFYSSSEMGWPKHQASSFTKLAKAESVTTADLIFIDDSRYNVEASLEAGCAGLDYVSLEQLQRDLNTIGLSE